MDELMEHLLKFLLSPWAWAMGFLWPLAAQTLVAAEVMASGLTAWAAGAVIALALALVVHFKGSWLWIK
jgi:hypothetical protein